MRRLWGLALVAITTLPSEGRGQAPSAELAKSFKLDFAIPDAPAFDLLEVDPSSVLRPTTVRELGLAVSDFVGDGTALTIPKAWALEVSPALLISGDKLSVADYRARPWLYRFRISGASRVAEEGDRPAAVALGLRGSIVDRADLRTLPNAVWRDTLTQTTALIVKARQAYQDSLSEGGMDPEAAAALADTREFPQLWEALEERRGVIQDSLWNAFAVDLALGIAAAGSDPSGNDLRVDRYGVWVSLAAPVTRSGQLLVGLWEGAERDSITADMRFTGKANARFYLGRNYAKIFLEGQAKLMDERSPVLLLNSGGEIRPPFGGWARLSAGIEFDSNSGSDNLVTNFAYKFGFPKLF
jgi:hypothetical protein